MDSFALKLKNSWDKFSNKFVSAVTNPWSLFYYVIILFIVGIGFYAYALFTQWFTTPFGGDYTQQQIPLFYNGYDDWWTFFKTGRFVMFDESLFLGGDNIGSNSFYYLFNPFFTITLLFPRDWIPQIMALESILKVVIAGLLMRLYLMYLGVKDHTARAFALAYAVCGWVAFYFWFNTFAEIATFLPIVLLGIEKVLKERKPVVLMVGIFLEAITNYFFLFTICIFGVGYALFRFFQTLKTRNAKQNWAAMGLGIGAFAVGIGLSAFAIIPGFLTASSSTRVSQTYLESLKEYREAGDWGKYFYTIFCDWGGESLYYRVYYPLITFFYPSMSCRYVPLVDLNYEWNMGSSIFVFVPTCLMFFTSIFNSAKNKKFSHFIAIGIFLILLFVPFFYYFFFAFNAQYGRWEIIAVICIVTYAALNFDKRKEMPKWFFIASCAITLVLMVFTYSLVYTTVYNNDKYDRVFNSDMVYLFTYIIILTLVESSIMMIFWKKEYLSRIVMLMFAVEAIVMGNMTQAGQGIISYEYSTNGGIANVTNETQVVNAIKQQDGSYYRIYSSEAYLGNENLPLREGYNGVSTFHSLYNYNVDDFLHMSHVLKSDSTWIGGIIEKRLNLDEFLGVKYYILNDADNTISYNKGTIKKVVNFNIPLGFEEISLPNIPNGYHVFVNTNYIDMGFSYDTLYYKYQDIETEKNSDNNIYNDFNSISNQNLSPIRNEESYLKGAILNNSDIEDIVNNNSGIELNIEHAPERDATLLSINRQVYSCNYNFDPFNPSQYQDSEKAHIKTTDELVNSQTELILTPSMGEYFTTSENGDYYILNYPLYKNGSSSFMANIYFYGDNENVPILKDDHTSPGGLYSSSHKALRGFGAKEKVKKIIIVPRSNVLYSNVDVYTESSNDYLSRINALKAYPLENVYNYVNEYGFTTNFDKQRFIVTQLAYEDGWTITATDVDGNQKQLKKYNAQGGFVGFLSEKGQTKYVLSFKSHGMDYAWPISLASFILFGGTIAGGAVIEHKRHKKQFKVENS